MVLQCVNKSPSSVTYHISGSDHNAYLMGRGSALSLHQPPMHNCDPWLHMQDKSQFVVLKTQQ